MFLLQLSSFRQPPNQCGQAALSGLGFGVAVTKHVPGPCACTPAWCGASKTGCPLHALPVRLPPAEPQRQVFANAPVQVARLKRCLYCSPGTPRSPAGGPGRSPSHRTGLHSTDQAVKMAAPDTSLGQKTWHSEPQPHGHNHTREGIGHQPHGQTHRGHPMLEPARAAEQVRDRPSTCHDGDSPRCHA